MIAVFTYPPQSQADAGSSEAIKESATQKPTDLQKQAQDVRKQQEEKKAQAQAVKPQSIKESDDEISKLLAKPIQDKDQLKDANNKLDGMENELKQKEKDLAAKNEAIQQQLRKFDQTSRKDPPQEGPAKDMQKALGEGDVKKAGEQAEDIAKKLKDGKLDEQAKKDLNKQIEDVEKKLSELKRQKDEDLKKEKDNIDKQLDRGDIDKKTAEQMKNDLDKKAENTKDLDQLADKMKQCQQCMKDGEGKDGKEGEAKSKEAGEKLQDAADQLKKMAGQQKEQQDLKDQIDDVKQIKQSLQPSQHGGKPVPGAGQRPEDKTGSTKSMDSKVTTPVAKDGRKAISDFVPGPAFKKKSTQDIAGEVVQASQEADAVREHQKVDRSAKDIYKGYFENLRKDLDRDPSPPKP
jgi:DNA repair exonuclease SbcCD ATPase subunit